MLLVGGWFYLQLLINHSQLLIRGSLPLIRSVQLTGEFFILLCNQGGDVKHLFHQNISLSRAK